MEEEDIMECECYIVIGSGIDGRIFLDRVYKNEDLAKKRIDYLNKISNGRGEWTLQYSHLHK